MSKGQLLNTLGPGAPFGETALLERAKRSVTVRALEPTKAMRIRGHDFYVMLEQERAMTRKAFTEFCTGDAPTPPYHER